MITRIATLCALLAPAVVPGQITTRVESLTELHVTAASSRQSVPPSTLLNGGSSLDLTFYDNRIFCRAASILDPVASDERGIRVRLVERGEALIMMGTGIAFAFVGEHRMGIRFESPVPVDVRLAVNCCFHPTTVFGSYSGELRTGGQSLLAAAGRPPCATAAPRVFDLTVGPAPLVLELRTNGAAAVGSPYIISQFHAEWTLELVRRSPCETEAYGAACGAVLNAHTTMQLPGRWIELVDPAGPTAAFLIVGTQRIRQPLESCFLYADPVVILPFSITAPDRATVYVPPPPFPVAVTLQGFTLVPAGLHASNGLSMTCQ